jgi:NitT/TauT family transport system ATP-binding protein
MPDRPFIAAAEIQQQFGDETVVAQTSFQIQRGEFVSFVGPSGCGKSTILRLIAGLLTPSAGRITVNDSSPHQIDRSRERIGFVFQEANLLPWRTAQQNVALPLELSRGELNSTARQDRIASSIARVGLTEMDGRKLPRMLSGGMKMRVSLARALVTEPTIMLMDEPFSALDDVLRGQLNEDLLGLWQEKQWTTLFVTHNIMEAVFLSQRILVMSGRPGRIVERIEVPFKYPRPFELQSHPEFTQVVAQVATKLREFAQQQQ